MKPRRKRHTNDKQGRKKVSRTQRKSATKNARSRSSHRAKETHRRVAKRKELVKKGKAETRVGVQSKSRTKGGNKPKGSNAKTRTGTLGISHPRSKHIIDATFKGAKSISKKVETFQKSTTIDKAIDKQLKRRGGKPPRGVVISIIDKQGITQTIVSRPSMVINTKNVKDLVMKLLKMEKKFKHSQYGSFDEAYDPDQIQSVNIRFVYPELYRRK